MLSKWKEKLPLTWLTEKTDNETVRRRMHLVFQIAVAVLFGILCAMMFFSSVTMLENSMEPAIDVGDRFFVNRIIYRVGSPERGDVIAFKTNGTDDAALHISRVIGLPGETVRISNGRIYIDEEIYDESASFPAIKNPGLASSSISLSSGEYFVLGDNRNNSEDSRYHDIGKVLKKHIVGKLWFQIYPWDSMGPCF